MQASKIAVIGAGSWGTVVAALLASQAASSPRQTGQPGPTEVVLACRAPALAAQMSGSGRNHRYAPLLQLPPSLTVTSSIREAVEGAGVVVVAVPSRWARAAIEEAAPWVGVHPLVLSLSKGLEPGSLCTMSQIVGQLLPSAVFAVLSGPNFASEIAQGLPAATVVACSDHERAIYVQALMSSGLLRVYTNDDVIGCEIAGAVKNVLALGAGMADGIGAGENARAAMMTRGLAELVRLGTAMGGHPLTFAGLAGLGDLVLTCTSDRSRNRSVGIELGRGASLDNILSSVSGVAEGVSTAPAVVALARRYNVEVPICAQVAAVLEGERTPAEAMVTLLGREPAHERAGAPTWRQ